MKKYRIPSVTLFLIGLVTIGTAWVQSPSHATGENWPQWRGPYQTGVSDAENLPTTWSEAENIVWKDSDACMEWWYADCMGR